MVYDTEKYKIIN